MSVAGATALPPPARPSDPAVDRQTYQRLATRVKVLSWASLAYMTLEGSIAILAGVLAGSVALVGFGIDSAIEGFASAIIVWRFTGARMFSAAAETRAQKLVAIQFFILAPYVGFESIQALVGGERADVSWLGIALSASSVVVMPYLGVAKQRLADQIGSAATKGEGRQNMLCAYLAGALLVGLLANAAFGAWWLDPIVGLLIAAIAVREGLEAWRGEGCSCTTDPLAALLEQDSQDAGCTDAGDDQEPRGACAAAARQDVSAGPNVTLEVLFFDGCPSHQQLLPILRELADEHGVVVVERRIDQRGGRRTGSLSGLAERARQRHRRRAGRG